MSKEILAILAINVITFLAFWHDKRISKGYGWRIPEKTLLLLALVGGSPAAILASKIFRHKTKKQPFKGLLYLTIFIQCVVAALYFNNH